jgi:hypothetical protein
LNKIGLQSEVSTNGAAGDMMMFANPAAIILATLAFGGPALGADIVGAWTIHGSVFFNAVDTVCLFKGENGAVMATCENDGKPGVYAPATLTDRKVAWNWDAGPAVLAFQGAFVSDTIITGELAVRGFTGKFTATKQ